MAAGTRMERQMSDWQPDPANPLWWNELPQLPRPAIGDRWRHWKLGEVVINGDVDDVLGEVPAWMADDIGGQQHVVKVRSLVEQL